MAQPWFRHDASASNDLKIMLLIDEQGNEGYGLFWRLLELLRSETEYRYPVAALPLLAKRFFVEPETLNAVVHRYELFLVEEGYFYSASLLRRMQAYDQLCEVRRESGARGGEAKARQAAKAKGQQPPAKPVAYARQTPAKPVASMNKSKSEERKESFSLPESMLLARVAIPAMPDKLSDEETMS